MINACWSSDTVYSKRMFSNIHNSRTSLKPLIRENHSFFPNTALNKKEECNCYSSVKAKGIPFGLRSFDQRVGKEGYSRYLFLIPVTAKHAQEQCQTCHCQNAVHIFVWQLHTLYVTVFL